VIKKRPRARAFLVMLVALMCFSAVACGRTATDEPAPPRSEETAVGPVYPSPGASTSAGVPAPAGGTVSWPAYIPEDIPPLEGQIRNVMEGPNHIRIFYTGLSREQIDDYLGLLGREGFDLQYIVYYDERYPDDPATKERLEHGDYDAVDITKGKYHLNIAYGEGEISLDVYTSGFEDSYPYAPVTEWPTELEGVIPRPERCRIDAVYAQEAGGYQIVCTPEDDEAVEDYVRALREAGYLPVEAPIVARPEVGGAYPEVYGRGELEVTVDYPPSTSTMRITTWPIDRSRLPAWPDELAGLVPEPQGGSLTMVQEWGDLEFMMALDGPTDRLLPDYVALLAANGFTEVHRTERPSGEPASISLQKGVFTVDVGPSATGITIRVSDEAVTYLTDP